MSLQVVSWLFTIPQVNTEAIDHQGNSALATAALCGMDGMVRLLGDQVSDPCCVPMTVCLWPMLCAYACVCVDCGPCCVPVTVAHDVCL